MLGRVLKNLLFPAAFVTAGWYGGAKYDAPDVMIQTIDGAIIQIKGLAGPLIGQGSDYVEGTAEDFIADISERLSESTSVEDNVTDNEDTAPITPQTNVTKKEHTPSVKTNSSDAITVCATNVSHAPKSNNGVVAPSGETVSYKGTKLLLMPATKACLSSGYGPRGSSGRLHKGVDYFSDTGGNVLAAGDGVIVEAVTRSDYGNMLVIDHGNGVFTRYAHLRRFGGGIRKGKQVQQGQIVGPIGKTGATSVVHLHWEILTGDYSSAAGSFGLDPVDPFSL